MIPHPDYDKHFAALGRHLATASAFNGTLFRACDPTYANTRDLLTGQGSRQFGGRWNAPGGFAIVYLSTKVEGAINETLGLSAKYGFDPADRLPLTFVAVNAILQKVLDLTDPHIRKFTGISLAAMNACDWKAANRAGSEALTQSLGRAAYQLGLHGILVPSVARRGARNLNVFPHHLHPPAHLTIRKAYKLAPPPGSI